MPVKKLSNISAPQNDAEAAEYICEIGKEERWLETINTKLKEKTAEVKQVHEEIAGPHKERHGALVAGLEMFCTANRQRLTQEGRVKHYTFSTGKVSWRQRPAAVTVRGAEKVLNWCRENAPRFIRSKQEINKEAMLACPSAANAIEGVIIKSAGEDFAVEPFGEGLSEQAHETRKET